VLSLLAASGAADPIYWTDLGLKPGIELGFFTLRYYSLAYLIGLIFAYWHTSRMLKEPGAPMAQRHADDLFTLCILGVIVGGRLGYAAFYTGGETGIPSAFTDFSGDGFVSWKLLRLWDGGMSFHGGLAGVTAAMAWVAWRDKLNFIRVVDYVCVGVPMGMLLGGWPISSTASCGAGGRPMCPGQWCFPPPTICRATPASSIRQGWKGWPC